MSLPLEVLRLVFSHLEAKDLLQCQLTSKQWHRASLKPLYTNLLVDKIEKLFTYVRTIKHLPQLGKYLNSIDFKSLFHKVSESDEFDKIGLLDSVLEHCPNITKMDGHVDNDRFWSRLIDAATQGQLSHLDTLPNPEDPSLESYITTTWTFKNVLTNLSINCDKIYSQPQLADSDPNITVYFQINEFKKVKALCLKSNYIEGLSYLDELIDKYHSVKRLNIDAYDSIDHSNRFIHPNEEPGPTILPRPGIHTLECPWGMISNKSQQEYVMRKFPNLQHLKVWSWFNEYIHENPDLNEFLRYALSVPDFDLEIEVDIQDIPPICDEFIKMKNGCKNVAFSYLDINNSLYDVKLSSESGLCLKFALSVHDFVTPHKHFLDEVGRSLQSLRIDCMEPFLFAEYGVDITIAWLFDILQLCPLLEELTIGDPTPSSPIHHAVQYPSLKRLTIDQPENIQAIDFLNCLSLNLPNLCQLSLILNNNYVDPVIIDMPHITFDLLLSSGGPAFKESEVYIKLKTDKGLEYYLGERSILVPISESRYLLSPKSVRFDINCKYLKELRIRRALPEVDFSFIF